MSLKPRDPQYSSSPRRGKDWSWFWWLVLLGLLAPGKPPRSRRPSRPPAGRPRSAAATSGGRCGEHPGPHLRLPLRCGTIPESRRFRDCSTCTLRRHVASSFHRLTSDTPSRAHDEPATAPPHHRVALSRRSLREPDVRSILVYGGTSV